MPDVIARLKPLGIHTVGNSSEEFARILAADIARWGDVARAGQYQDRAVALRLLGETSPTMTVAIAATAMLRISAPSPT